MSSAIHRWKEFLQRQGANYAATGVQDFGAPDTECQAAATGTVLVDLSHFSLIRVGGPDAKSFLNGQLTNDVGLLDGRHTQLSAWCSAKGRMLAVFRVIPESDGYLLRLPGVLRDDILKRLRMYVLRAKTALASADDTVVLIGVAGATAEAVVRTVTGLMPEGDNACASSAGMTIARVPGVQPRFEIVTPLTEAPTLWESLQRHATPAGKDAWTSHEISAGLPIVLPETAESFVPQMTNLDLLGGVSFNKGCYTGQEIVARVHYLGRLKQRMYRAHVDTAELPEPGTDVYGGDREDQSTGTVVVAAPSASGGSDLLAVIHTSSVGAGELRLARPDGPRLVIATLPYSVS